VTLDLYAFQMSDGRKLVPLPTSKAGWTLTTNADESVTCTIPAKDPAVRRLEIWVNTELARNGLYAEVDGEPIAGGPIWKRRYSAKAGTIALTAGGPRSYWNKRILLPPTAASRPLVNATTGDPDASLDTVLDGLSYGTIAKRYIQLAQLWPNGSIPMSLPPDVTGTKKREVKAIDLKSVGKLITDLSNVDGGPDFAFRIRRSSDGLGVYWEMQHGSDTVPRLGSTDAANTKWTVGAPRSGAFDLEIEEDGSGLASRAWFTGGGSADKVVVAKAYRPELIDLGYPLLETADTGHSDVTEQATANDYAAKAAELGQYAASFWSMSVRAREKGSPRLGDYWLGDMATITVDKSEPVIPAGDYERRIAAISGDEKDSAYSITFAEALA
jgi:hypothetical protein